jgi:hypothetical protein
MISARDISVAAAAVVDDGFVSGPDVCVEDLHVVV